MSERLLGGPGFTPASVEDKREFAELCKKWPLVTQEELDRMQRIEWSLTYAEYQLLKFGKKVDGDPRTRDSSTSRQAG